MGRIDTSLLPRAEMYPVLAPLPGAASRYILMRDFRVIADDLGVDFEIPRGYVYDGASVPTITGLSWAATYAKCDSRVMRAAMVHDWFCDARPPNVSSRPAADLFHQMLLEDGATRPRAWTMRAAVRAFGPQWG